MNARRAITTKHLIAKKERGERIVMVTAYDYPSALYADQAGVDAILVGDTLGMVVLGHPTTIPVTLEAMLHHVQAVMRAQPRALVVADMPFLTYQVNADEAMRNAGRLIQEGGAHVVPLVERLVCAGVPVMGHLGLTPQSVHQLGGYRVQARSAELARRLYEDALALEGVGAFAVVLESVPSEVAEAVTAALAIPTIGIGAGPQCDGEVQVFHDLLGLFDGFLPRHTKRYATLGDTIREALSRYAEEVRNGTFPAAENTVYQAELRDSEQWTSSPTKRRPT
jgi:3-methyl-2-oxobutanoate hydroxymethyltransferase